MTPNRVVITGMGVISPIGTGLKKFWTNLVEGVSGITTITRFDPADFDAKIAGEVKDFDPEEYLEKKEVKRMDRFTQYALASTKMAIEDASLDLEKENKDEIGVIFGTGIGGIGTLEEQTKIYLDKGPGRISPFFIPMIISDIAAGQIAISFGLKGVNQSLVNACATGTNALGDAFRYLKWGEAEVIISGGSEAPVTPMAVGGFCAMKALSTRNDEPTKASRPFDRERDGFVLGEGCGVLVLETLDHALKRGARIYAEIVGYGSTADAYHITQPEPTGYGAALAMTKALKEGNISPEEVDYINAHGTSTFLNDRSETIAIKRVFGKHAYKLAVSSNKSMVGHLLGAAGAVEAIATSLTIYNSLVPPTINYEYFDEECDLDYVPNRARQMEVNTAISESFGFGGHNAVLALKKFEA